MSDCLIVIPARLAATRLPGKPLATIGKAPMIVHVWARACEAGCGPVIVATDALEVAHAVREAGGTAVMTRADHASGSDRVFEAVSSFDPEGKFDVVVNLQGDLPTLDPALAAPLHRGARRGARRHRHHRRGDRPRRGAHRRERREGGRRGRRRRHDTARALFHPRDRAARRGPALPSHRRLCLPARGARTLRQAAAVSARTPRAARAAPRTRSRHAHRRWPR